MAGVERANEIPIGVVNPFAGSSAPTGYLLCDGSEKAVATFPALDAVLGTTYGARTNGSGSPGSTHFRLPDIRGRAIAGKDNMGGTAASRLTATVLSAADTLGATGGTQTHTLGTTEIPSHSHTMTSVFNASTGAAGLTPGASFQIGSPQTGNTGGGLAHTNTQPTIVLNYIIKAA